MDKKPLLVMSLMMFHVVVLRGSTGFGATPVERDKPVDVVAPKSSVPTEDVEASTPAARLLDLIGQLGDGEPTIRDEATTKLADLGKAALPELQKAKDADDPEIRSRVRSLIRKAERRLPPAAPLRDGKSHRHSMSMSLVDGQKTVDVDDNGYRIRIRQGREGIILDVTGVEDGKAVTETFRARDADQLRKEAPEAFVLYEKYVSGRANAGLTVRMGAGGGLVEPRPAGEGIGGRVEAEHADVARRVIEAQLRALEGIRVQLGRHPDIHAEQVARLNEQIQALRARAAELEAKQDVQQKLMKDMEERRRNAVDAQKVPLRDEPDDTPR